MRIRSILYILFISSFIGVFFYSNILSEKIDDDFSSDSIRKSSIQLAPFPVILSKNSGEQNSALYDLLINKSEEPIVLYDTDVDLGGFNKILPFEPKHLVLEFKYNIEKERLEFTGSDLKSRKIHGHCLITNKNNIRYDINIKHEKYNLQIESIHNPDNEGIDASVEGSFKFHSNMRDTLSLISDVSLNKSEDVDVLIRGDFSSKGDLLRLSNVKLENNQINIDAEIDISASSPLFKINVNTPRLNLDELNINRFGIDDNFVAQDLIESFSKFNFKFNFITNDFVYKSTNLKNASIAVSSKNNSEIEIDNLSFEFDKNGLFNTKGIISNAKHMTHYKGDISLKNVQYNDLENIFGFVAPKFKNKKRIDISSQVYLHPSLIVLKEFSVKEGKKIFDAKRLEYSFVDEDRNVITGDIKISKDVNGSNVANALIEKYLYMQSYAKEKSVIDINFALVNDISIADSREIYLNYAYDNSLHINNIIFPHSKVEANMNVDTKSCKFKISIVGDDMDLNSVHEFMQDLSYISSFSNINSKVFSGKNVSMPGDISINMHGKDSNHFKNFKCELSYINDEATFSSCDLETVEGKLLLSGKVGKSKKGMYYDISYKGDKLVVPSDIFDRKIIDGSNGKVEVNGNVVSKGIDASELSKNMIGSASIKFFDVKLKTASDANVVNGNQALETKESVLSLVKGNFDFSDGLVKSDNVEYITHSNHKGLLMLETDVEKKSTKINMISDKKN